MKNKKFTKKQYILIGAGVLVLAIIAFFTFNKGNANATHIVIKKQNITQSVLTAGKTKAVDSVDLGFEKSGRVTATYVDVGSRVVAGQTLILLDSSELQADLLKAQADLAEERASNLTDNVAISDANANARAVISDSYTKADNVVRESIDQFFDYLGNNNDNFQPSVLDGGRGVYFSIPFDERKSINYKRKEVEKELQTWKVEISGLSSENVDSVQSRSEDHLKIIKELVDQVSFVIFEITTYDVNVSATLTEYKNDASSARTSVNTIISNLISAREKLNTARASETKLISSTNSISAQSARVLQFQAQIQNIQSQISKTKISASFDGVVTKQDVEVSEIVTAGETIVSVISDKKLEIESNVPEVNIGKIVIGNTVSITMDAYPGEAFFGIVSYIDPGETIVDSVVNYKVTIAIKSDVTKLKSGLTANLNIETGKKDGVVAVPLFAVTKKGNKSYVQKVSGENAVQTEVTLGIVGQDGMTEVLSGLGEGDTVEVGQ